MIKSETIGEFAKAFAKTQQEIKQPLKDAKNPFFKSEYVPLENVAESITTAASANGLSYSQEPSFNAEQGVVTVSTLVMHTSGEWIEYEPLRLKPVKTDPQSVGSAITYAKRYALSAIFGVTSDKDDDGNGASQGQPAKATKPAPKQQASQPQGQPQAPSGFISNEQHNQILDSIRELARLSGRPFDDLVNFTINHFKIKDFHQVPEEHFNTVMDYIRASKAKAQGQNDFNNL